MAEKAGSEKKQRAIVLLSGGLDSATVFAVAYQEGYQIVALSFDYGQRHVRELEAARAIAQGWGVQHHAIVNLDLRAFGGSALTDNIEVPKGRSDKEIGEGIPVTYVPARNTIFLSHALALAEVEGARDIFIGVNALDYSGYPDCRPEYISAFQTMANLATKACIEETPGLLIRSPLQDFTKAKIVELGTHLGVDFANTLSCYDPPGGRGDFSHCGICDACQLRRKGFEEASIHDPTRYKN
ncbi:MAG: 7-cyano-7-deazaguanine synthase QueC [Rhodospirillaceae bacterium TMED8]|nr:7-cyano-7-deazaguanine synthase QueC [Magnetovibrio sp.]OUT49859.1 MAG: 7-cyano-7-deazaguanine synthase QueC [Rhodospirillaceae bacterium TMED8]|tara:strand:- start:6861 stop:7583 length:723 start_codon:yes stop_codon:yes gene_type:complete